MWRAAFVLLFLSSGAGAARRSSSAPRGETGQVIYVTSEHAFLNRGKSSGIEAGMQLKLSRQGAAAASCQVDTVAEHSAACKGTGLRPGDTFPLQPPSKSAQQVLPPIASAQEIAQRGAALSKAQIEKVEFVSPTGQTLFSSGFTAEADLTHQVWTSTPQADRPSGRTFQSEELDLALRGLPITHGLRFSLDASVIAWTQRPSDFRLPQQSAFLVYLREAEITRREGDGVQASAGRIWPVSAPGVGVIDGLQAGWRASGLEVGAFGGLVPDPISTAPATDRWTAGAYFGWETANKPGELISYLHEMARASVLALPDQLDGSSELRGQVESATNMRLHDTVDVFADLRFGAGTASSPGNAPGYLEALRLDVSARWTDQVRLSLGLRYNGLIPTDFLSLGEGSYEHRGLHADGSADFVLGPSIILTLIGGAYHDDDVGLTRAEGGPQLLFPHLFGPWGSLGIGYLYSYGWWGRQDGYLQTMLTPSKTVRIAARLIYEQDAPGTDGTGSYSVHQVGLVGSAEWAFHPSFFARVSLSSITDLEAAEGLFGAGPPITNNPGSQLYLTATSLRDSSPTMLNAALTLGGRL